MTEEISRSILDDMRREYRPVVMTDEFHQASKLVKNCQRCDINKGEPCCTEHYDAWRTIALAVEEWENRPTCKGENE